MHVVNSKSNLVRKKQVFSISYSFLNTFNADPLINISCFIIHHLCFSIITNYWIYKCFGLSNKLSKCASVASKLVSY
jgi:hypothetical protein